MEIQRSTRKAAKQSASSMGGGGGGGGGGLSSVGNIEAWEEALDFFFIAVCSVVYATKAWRLVLFTSPESKHHPATFFWCTVRPKIEFGIIRSRVRYLNHYTTQAVLLFYSGFVQLSRPQRPVTLHVLLTNPESKYHPATFFRCMVRPRIVVLYHFGAFWL